MISSHFIVWFPIIISWSDGLPDVCEEGPGVCCGLGRWGVGTPGEEVDSGHRTLITGARGLVPGVRWTEGG